jgi:hypothetical protein
MYRKFEQEGTVMEEKRPRAPIARSPGNVKAIPLAMQRSPGKSTRKAAR